MRFSLRLLPLLLIPWLALQSANTLPAQLVPIVREGVEQVMAALGKTAAKSGAAETAEQLAKVGGREAVEQVCAAVTREGGEAALQQVASVTAKAGPDALLALKNVAKPAVIVKQLDELPVEMVGKASQRLAAGSEGKALGELAERYGVGALKAEAAHPGVGSILIRDLGEEGVELAGKLTTTQAQQLAAVAREVAVLPVQQKATVMTAIRENSEGFFKWLGGLIKENPGKIVLGTASVVVLETHWAEIIGTPQQPGFIPSAIQSTVGRPVAALNSGVETLFTFGVPVVLLALSGWIGLKLRHGHKLQKIAQEKARREAGLNTDNGPRMS